MSNQTKALKSFGQNLEKIRKMRGFTQECLAEKAGYDPTYISLLERGKRNPPLLTIVNMAFCLDCRIRDLTDID